MLAILAVLWLAYQLRTLIFIVFVALFVAIAFEPPVQYLSKRGWRRGTATAIVFLVATLLAVGFIWSLAPLFVEQTRQIVEQAPGLIEGFIEFLREELGFDLAAFDTTDIGEQVVSAIQSVGSTLVGGVVGFTSTIFGLVFFGATTALFSFYMLAELPSLQRSILSFMPAPQQRRALRIWEVAVQKMGGYVYSRLILAVLSAVASAIFLRVVDVPFAVSLGIWVGVLSQTIPVVGTFLASALPALVALTFNDWTTAIWVVVFFVAYQQVENYLISPRITKRTMEIHPAISVAAVIIGATLLGGIGVIFALPVAGIIQASVSEWRRGYEVVLDQSGEVESEESDDSGLAVT